MRTHARPNFLEMEKDEQNYESGQYRARARDHRYHGYLAERLVVFMAFVFFFGAFLAFMVFMVFMAFVQYMRPSWMSDSRLPPHPEQKPSLFPIRRSIHVLSMSRAISC